MDLDQYTRNVDREVRGHDGSERFAVINDIGIEVNRYESRAFAETVAHSMGGRVVEVTRG